VYWLKKRDNSEEAQDILKVKPVPIKVVYETPASDLMRDPNYYLIVSLLRKGPMTRRDIVEAYNKSAIDNDNVKQKSEVTIFRYLRALEKAGLVMKAGRRVVFGKTASEILFSRTADIFMHRVFTESYWKSKMGKVFMNRVVKALQKINGEHELQEDCFKKFLMQFEKAKDKEIVRLIKNSDDDIIQAIVEGDWWEVEQIFGYIGVLGVFLNQSKLMEKLQTCFE
jgi:hypothetical protein